jgi:alpha-1,3-rhamnosyltransferase
MTKCVVEKTITIGIMTYNQENFIEDTLQSIIDQSYNNIELLILDDHSLDRTLAKIHGMNKLLKDRFVHYRLLIHKENSGNISANINELLRNAHGDYFKCIGGDDLLLPNYCMAAVKAFESDQSIEYVFSDMCIVDGDYRYGQEYDVTHRYMHYSVPDEPNKLFNRLLYGNYLPAPSFLFKTDMLKQIGGFDEEFTMEDYPMWLKLSHAGIQHCYIEKPYVLYRVTGMSLSRCSMEEHKIRMKRVEYIADNVIRSVDKYCTDSTHQIYEKIMTINMENAALLSCQMQAYEEGAHIDAEAEKRGLMISADHYIHDDSSISVLKYWQTENAVDWFRQFLIQNSICTVAVYGFGMRGQRLVRFLKKVGIETTYLIDQGGQKLSKSYRIYKPGEIFPDVDAVFISLYHPLDTEQKKMLVDHGCRRVIEIEDVIFDENIKQV